MMLQKFLDAVRSDPKAQELISAMTPPRKRQRGSGSLCQNSERTGFRPDR